MPTDDYGAHNRSCDISRPQQSRFALLFRAQTSDGVLLGGKTCRDKSRDKSKRNGQHKHTQHNGQGKQHDVCYVKQVVQDNVDDNADNDGKHNAPIMEVSVLKMVEISFLRAPRLRNTPISLVRSITEV